MRVLYLTADPGIPVFGGKGASVHVRAMATALAHVGHDVLVASPRIEPGEERLPSGVRCVEIPAVRPRSLSTEAEVLAAMETQAASVLELARQTGIQAIFERYSLTGRAGARTAGALGVPLIVEVNAPLREEERRFRQLAHERLALAAERETFAAASLVVAVSDWLAAWLRAHGVPEDRIAVIPNPAPDQLFAPRDALAEHNTVTVGFSGSLKPWHGVATLLAGFLEAVDAGARMRLEILGEGPEKPAVERAAADSKAISALGHVPHGVALDRLKGWDIGVAPYAANDGFYFSPLKLAEYMAAGLCPVVTDVGPLADVVEGGRAGVVVAPDDPHALAQALRALDADRDRLRALGDRARALARQRPTWIQVAELLSPVLSGEAASRVTAVPA